MNQHSLVLSGPFTETLGESPKAVEARGPKSPSLSSSLLSCLSLRQAEQLGKAVREHLSRCCPALPALWLQATTAGTPPARAPPPRVRLRLLVRYLWQSIVAPCKKSLFPREANSCAESSCPYRDSACLVLMAHLCFLTAAGST